ncbi:MAG: exosortase/archaeosortase family protein [Candidatus Nanohaloarchaea archaeon]
MKEFLEPKDMDERQEKLFNTSVFMARLLLIGLVFQAVLFIYPSTYGLQEGFAEMMAAILNSIGIESSAEKVFVYAGNEVYRITQDCLGWKSAAALTGLVMASPGDRGGRARFAAVGIAALMVANIFRVLTTIYLSHIGFLSFDIIHGIFWKWGLTVLVLAMWIYWFRARNSQANL